MSNQSVFPSAPGSLTLTTPVLTTLATHSRPFGSVRERPVELDTAVASAPFQSNEATIGRYFRVAAGELRTKLIEGVAALAA
jgi:hypothetical protein